MPVCPIISDAKCDHLVKVVPADLSIVKWIFPFVNSNSSVSWIACLRLCDYPVWIPPQIFTLWLLAAIDTFSELTILLVTARWRFFLILLSILHSLSRKVFLSLHGFFYCYCYSMCKNPLSSLFFLMFQLGPVGVPSNWLYVPHFF